MTFNAVHAPLQAPAKYLDRFSSIEDERRRTYAAMLSALDDNVGQVLGKLRDLKLEENTLIFFISDNGGPPKGNSSLNDPLNGAKATVWEGGIRIPYVVSWKGHVPAGAVLDQPVITLDIPATVAAAAARSSADRRSTASICCRTSPAKPRTLRTPNSFGDSVPNGRFAKASTSC